MTSRSGAVIPTPGNDEEIEATVLPRLDPQDTTVKPPSSLPQTTTTTQAAPKDLVDVHLSSYCCGKACADRWGIPIMGVRYQCVSCDRDFVHNLCASCFATYPYLHPDSPIDRSMCVESMLLVWRLRVAHQHLYEANSATAHVFVAVAPAASYHERKDRLMEVERTRLIRWCMRPSYTQFIDDLSLTLVESVGRTLYLMMLLPLRAIQARWSRRSNPPAPPSTATDTPDKPTNTNEPTPTPDTDSGGRVPVENAIAWGALLVAGLAGTFHTNMIALGGLARAYTATMNILLMVLMAPLTYESGNCVKSYLVADVPADVAVAPTADQQQPTTPTGPTEASTTKLSSDTYASDTDPTKSASTVSDHPDLWIYELLKALRRQNVGNEFATDGTFVVTVPPDTLAQQRTHTELRTPGADPPAAQIRVDGAKVFGMRRATRHMSMVPIVCLCMGVGWVLVQIVVNEVSLIAPSLFFNSILQLPTYDPYDIASETVELCSRLDNDSAVITARMALRLRITPPVSADQGLPIVTTWFIDGTNLSTNDTAAFVERETFTRLPIVTEVVWPTTTRASTVTSFTVVVTEDATTGGDFIDAIVNFPGRACPDLASVIPVSTHTFADPLKLVDMGDDNNPVAIAHLISFVAMLVSFFFGLFVVRTMLIACIADIYPMWCALDKMVCSESSHCVRTTTKHTTKTANRQVVDARPLPPLLVTTPTVTRNTQPVRTCGIWVHDLAQFVPIDFAIPDNCLAWRQIRRTLVLKTKSDLTLAIGYLHVILVQAAVSLGVLSYYVVIGSAPLKTFIVLLLSFVTSIDAILMLVPLAYAHHVQSGHHVMLTKHVLGIRSLPPTDDPVIDAQRQRSVEILESMIAELAIEDDYIKLFGVIPSVGLLQTLGAIAVSGISTFISTPMQFHM